jgi:hypothetical protein
MMAYEIFNLPADPFPERTGPIPYGIQIITQFVSVFLVHRVGLFFTMDALYRLSYVGVAQAYQIPGNKSTILLPNK